MSDFEMQTSRWEWKLMPDGKMMLFIFFSPDQILKTMEHALELTKKAGEKDEVGLGFELPQFKDQFLPAKGWEMMEKLSIVENKKDAGTL